MRRSVIAAAGLVAPLIGVASCALVAGLGDERELASQTDAVDGSKPIEDAPRVTPGNEGGPVGDAQPPDGGYMGDGLPPIAVGQKGPYGIAVERTYVVWSTTGDPVKPGTGGIVLYVKSANQLVSAVGGQASPKQVIVDDSTTYWYNSDNPLVLDGGTAVKVLTLGSFTFGQTDALLIDDDTVADRTHRIAVQPTGDGGTDDGLIFVAMTDRVRRFNRGASTGAKDIAMIPMGMRPVTAVAVDATNVFWFNASTVARRAKIESGPGNGNAPPIETVGIVNAPVVDMAISGTTLWMATNTGDVYTLPTDQINQTAVKLATTGAIHHAIVVNGDVAYIARGTPKTYDGQIVAVNAAGTVKIVADHLPEPRELAIDTSVTPPVIYWTNGGDDTIRKITATVP